MCQCICKYVTISINVKHERKSILKIEITSLVHLNEFIKKYSNNKYKLLIHITSNGVLLDAPNKSDVNSYTHTFYLHIYRSMRISNIRQQETTTSKVFKQNNCKHMA